MIFECDHKGGALYNLIKGELQESDDFKVLLGELCAELNEVETALVAMVEIADVTVTKGVNLDVHGRRWNFDRSGLVDDDYALFLQAVQKANKSSGTPPELYNVIHAMDVSGVSTLKIQPEYPGNLRIDFTDPPMPGDGAIAMTRAQVISIAKTAGVGVFFVWVPIPDSGAVAIHGDYWAPGSPFPGNYTAHDSDAGTPHTATPPYEGMGDYWTPGIGDVMSGVIKV